VRLQSLSLDSWHTVLVELALEAGCFVPILAFFSMVWRRRGLPSVLTLVPMAAFVWIALLARDAQIQDAYWQHYLAFVAEYYPADAYPLLAQQTQQDVDAATHAFDSEGWTAVFVTQGTVLFSGFLLVRWYGPRERGGAPVVPTPSEGSDGELEITVEPMERHRSI
jgi:hypothetical protein